MENIVELVVIALFILASLVGGRRKGGAGSKPKGEAPDAGRSGRGRAGGERYEPARAGADPRGRDGERESAATMVPDDLWSVLTGEGRAPAGSGSGSPRDPEPVPAGAGDESSGSVDERRNADAGSASAGRVDGRATTEKPAWDDEARSLESIPEPDYPRVVSLEERPLPPEVRRELALRRGRMTTAPPAPNRRRRRLPLGLHDRDAVRRAVIVREVLGPPKGLQS